MSSDLIPLTAPKLPVSKRELAKLLKDFEPPRIVLEAGQYSSYAYVEFFTAEIKNENTRKAYRRNVDRFLNWLEKMNLAWSDVSAPVVSEYMDKHLHKDDGGELSAAAKKQHLAAIKHFYDVQERRHGILFNPASAVRGPAPQSKRTRPFQEGQVKQILDAIDTSHIVGLRDRAVIATLYWTAARAGAVANLRLGHWYSDGKRWWFDFGEKGGKPHTVMANHTLQIYLNEYIQEAEIRDDPKTCHLFRSTVRKTKLLSEYRPPRRNSSGRGYLSGNDVLRLVKRRTSDAGLPADTFKAHSFRATTATNLRKNGVSRDRVQYLLGHASARTTQVYDHSDEEQNMDIVDQITL